MSEWLTIPAPPSVNALFANVAGKGRVKSKRYREWLNAAGWRLQAQKSKWPAIPTGSAYGVAIRLPLNIRTDIDNTAKPILDLLTSFGVTPDDRHLVSLVILKNGPAGSDVAVMARGPEAETAE